MPQNYKVVLALNCQGQGWQETYWTASTFNTNADVMDICRIMSWGRTLFFGSGVTLELARIIGPDAIKDALICQLPYPVGPHPSWQPGPGTGQDTLGDPEDPFTAVMFKQATSVGQWANRYFRGCPDHYIANRTLQFPAMFNLDPAQVPFIDPDPARSPGALHTPLALKFWPWFAQNIGFRHRDPGTGLYTVIAPNYITYRKITRRASGVGFAQSRGRRQKNTIS